MALPRDLDQLFEVPGGRRDAGQRLGVARDLEPERVGEVDPRAVVGEQHLRRQPGRELLVTLVRGLHLLRERGGARLEVRGVRRVGRAERARDLARNDGAVARVEPVVRVAVRVHVALRRERGAGGRRLLERADPLAAVHHAQAWVARAVDDPVGPLVESEPDLEVHAGARDLHHVRGQHLDAVHVGAGAGDGEDLDLVAAHRAGDRGEVGDRGADAQLGGGGSRQRQQREAGGEGGGASDGSAHGGRS